ncbi:MAG: folate-binding protein YgfZ [Hyphomicrobiales bacterium]|nr:folate-binding protein YgfZ [Hyphomicrobiales bacterium]
MDQPKYCELYNRKLLKIGNSEAESFLQGILTCNLDTILPSSAGFGGLLTPQGKILFDFFVVRADSDFLLDVDANQIDELVRRLTFYRLRADVSFEICSEGTKVFGGWANGVLRPEVSDNVEGIIIVDPRLDKMGIRIYAQSTPERMKLDDIRQYNAHRIELGVPEGGVDYHYGNAFPHEALYDQMGGVDFTKGCYVGQEVVSRMHHRGTARKRIIQISSKNIIPLPGSKITISDRSAGEVTSSAGNKGLALLRLDLVGQAIKNNQEILAGDIIITPQIQPWASFSWPSEKQAN